MRASVSTLLLLAVVVAAAASDCELKTLEDAVTVPSPLLLGVRQEVEAASQTLATLDVEPDWKTLSDHVRAVLDAAPEHFDATAVAVQVGAVTAVAYRKDGVVLVEGDHNQSAEGFWRQLEAAVNVSGGAWSPPFLDCLTKDWLFGYSTSLTGPFRGATGMFLPLRHLDVHQCNDSFGPVFGSTHSCDLKSTECVPAEGSGMRRDFRCDCRPGYWRGPGGGDGGTNRCVPCEADGTGACWVRPNHLLRTVVLVVQVLCMSITVVLAFVVFRQRKCKTIATGMWTILETILLGTVLLYATVVVRFFDPSVEQCLLEPWCRELGFVICYGAIILKLYRILIEFRTRKAHRWVVRDKDLLKYLLGMVLVVFGYMAAWTATNLNFIQENYSILTQGRTHEGLQFRACKALWWDYVTETGEILILVFGIHLSYACRNATTQFQERRFLCLAITVEATVSGVFYVLRIVYAETLLPDFSYIAYFIRSQLTSTVVLLLIFMPKLWYQHRGTRHYLPQEFSTRQPLDAFKPQDGVPGANSSDADVGEINLADMNPDDIRAELKRLYTQLEVLKNKTIRADNPHISKRRGGRKVAHRRFSLQALHHRHQRCSSRHPAATDVEVTEAEVSRTPEDSVCSNEGPSAIYNDGPSTYSELGGCATPNVSYRHKQ